MLTLWLILMMRLLLTSILTLILLAGVVNVVVNDVDVFIKDEDCDRDHGGSGHPVRLEVWQGRGRSDSPLLTGELFVYQKCMKSPQLKRREDDIGKYCVRTSAKKSFMMGGGGEVPLRNTLS